MLDDHQDHPEVKRDEKGATAVEYGLLVALIAADHRRGHAAR